ncbi:MAG TPA: N-acetylmuramoyl-L-alanine amidase [Epulopiscium sp.]|nr:N-acetylmuramoyl-L-alanine amidase [Candidatus Epulonipiscium sp.]
MITIKKDHLPIGHKKRCQYLQRPIYITVHSTANPTSTAQNERAWLTNPNNKTETGFHYVVDEKEAIECIPPNEVAWHAGDNKGQGNMASIGLEICESGNREKTLENAIKLIQHLMKVHKITKIARHYDWSKKNCPRILNKKGDWSEWNIFLTKIQQTKIKPIKSEYVKAIEVLIRYNIITSPGYWKAEENKNIHALIIKTARVLETGL